MLGSVLYADDAERAVAVLRRLREHRLDAALTGGLAVAAHLRGLGRSAPPRRLNDIDFVIAGIGDVPQSLAGEFLFNHVHPDAPEGKTLIQVVDRTHRLRIDFFRAFGATLARAVSWPTEVGLITLAGLEDLVARQTSLVCGTLERGRAIDAKHVASFQVLTGLGTPERLHAAWADHRQEVAGTLEEAARRARALLEQHPELVVVETYRPRTVPCGRCRAYGRLDPAPSDVVAGILGYS